eukprot:7362511-Pyramimonas_sp.AAC.1
MLNPKTHFNWPQNRPRIWIVAIKFSKLGPSCTEENVEDVLLTLMRSFTAAHPKTSLADVLLPESHPYVQRFLKTAEGAKYKTPPRKQHAGN